MFTAKNPIRKIITKTTKHFLSYIPLSFLYKLTQIVILNKEFKDLKSSKVFPKREDMWDYLLKKVGKREKIVYVEFGVWEGYSISYFAENNFNKNSLFIGLDSFKGLPENWKEGAPKGRFSLNGNVPIFKDSRISIIDGYFQDTKSLLVEKLESIIKENDDFKLIVHYDADLYSSTLFALSLIDSFNKNYFAIFDEIFDQESRAFYDYVKSFGSKIKFTGRVPHKDKDCEAVRALCEVKVKLN